MAEKMKPYKSKPYVVRHKPEQSSTWKAVGYFESVGDALAEYEELRKAYLRERVWVVDLNSDQVLADSRIK